MRNRWLGALLAALSLVLAGCSACRDVGNACGNAWSNCTSAFSGGGGGGDAGYSDPIYDSPEAVDRSE